MKNNKKTISIILGCLLFTILLVQFSSTEAATDMLARFGLKENYTQLQNSGENSGGGIDTQPTADENAGSSPMGRAIAPAATSHATLLFSEIYSGGTVKSYEELLAEGLVQPDTTNILLSFDLTEPVIFSGISGLPTETRLDIDVMGSTDINALPYIAIAPGVTVGSITSSTPGTLIGGIVVMGTAESITIAQEITIQAELAITGDAGNYTWEADNASANVRTSLITGVVIGAYDGGAISGAITLEGKSSINAYTTGFMGCVIGAYRNAKVGDIILGDEINFDVGYVQTVVGANENSTAGNITTGNQFYIQYFNAEFAVIGAASGLPDAERKPSSVGVISMRQYSNIFSGYSDDPDLFSNVCIGAERGSTVAQIRIEETLEWVSNPENAFGMMFFSNSNRVTIGAYDSATVGTSPTTDAIVMSYISAWNSSYYSGVTFVGAEKNSTIQGNIVFHVSGINSSFSDADIYKSVIGTSDNSHVTGTILLEGLAYASSWANPTTIIGPSDATSSVHEIKVEKFASIRSWDYDAVNYSIFGYPGARVDKLWINGDLMIQMPKNTYIPLHFTAEGADFIADEILITSGNIIAQDISIKYDGSEGSPSQIYRDDPDRMNKVPPWIHNSIKMSVTPKNQFGQALTPYTILDPTPIIGSQFIDPVSQPITVFDSAGNSYIYKFGNDIRKYMSLLYGNDFSGQGAIRPSWVPDIYPIWWYEGMELDAPFVHFVYLPQSDITSISYNPANTNGQIDTTLNATSVQLNLPLSLDFMSSNGKEPLVKITNSATGQQLISFALNMDNYSKYFTFETSSQVTGTTGNSIVLNLLQIPGIQKDTAYTVTIQNNSLVAEFAITDNLNVQNALVQNANSITWQFRIPSQTPPTTSAPPVSSSVPPVSTSTPQSSTSIASSSTSAATSSSSSVVSSGSSSASAPPSSSLPSVSSEIPEPENDNLTPAERREKTLQQLIEKGVPVLQIGNSSVPLFSRGVSGVWSFFNLLIAVAGMSASLATCILHLLKKRNKALGIDAGQETSPTEAVPFWQNPIVLLWAGIGAGILLFILFLLTQNMRSLMVVFDKWSWLMGILAAAQTALLIIAHKKSADKTPPATDTLE